MTPARRGPLSVLLSSLLAVGSVVSAPAPARAQVDLSVLPAMTRGPEDAPVTIVEFLDFE